MDGRTAGILLPAIGCRWLYCGESKFYKLLFVFFNYDETIGLIIGHFVVFSELYCAADWLH